VTPRRKKPKGESPAPRPRKGRGRQRQRLIEACISALHIYGPSRTTVQKVVAIAKMSPGIVRFYFNSKASMLVASLQFLAAEFEQQLLIPVSTLKSTPVAALERLVDLYLDPELASPRKVSVWYSFWGEASSRQEYYDICGQKDESFAVLVRQLIESLIIETSQPQLDPDGVALGLIGVLEMLWQDFAFKTELDIDRPAAKRRCMAYLRSIFPGQFPVPPGPTSRAAAAAGARRAGWAYADARIHALERERLFQGAWTVVGHESQVPRRGDFLSADIGAERLVLVRGESGSLHALRNSCPESPHALVTSGSGHLDAIECRLHGLRFALNGRRGGTGREDLGVLELSSLGGFLFVRPGAPGRGAEDRSPESWLEPQAPGGLRMLGRPWEMPVAADWKVVVELWLESMGDLAGAHAARPPGSEQHGCVQQSTMDSLVWQGARAGGPGWSETRYRTLVPDGAGEWRRRFIAPHQMLEARPDGMSILQAVPSGPGACVIRRLDYTRLAADRPARAALYLAQRLTPCSRRSTRDAAQSMQRGIVEYGYELPPTSSSAAVAWFRDRLRRRIPEMGGA
jgi:TetR/AcrR family transcriptional repressor of bet genes